MERIPTKAEKYYELGEEIDVSKIVNGLYIAELRNAKGDKVVRQKLVVQH